jgi:hypothetical protein
MLDIIFEISNNDENFQIGIFESFDEKENLLRLYESLLVSTEKEFNDAIALNFTSSDQTETCSQYYIASNKNLITTKLNKDDVAFVEQIQELVSENNFEKEYLAFSSLPISKFVSKISKKEIIQQPNQLSILLGFKTAPISPVASVIKTSNGNKPGRGQKSCKYCFEVIGVRCLICKFCNKSLV